MSGRDRDELLAAYLDGRLAGEEERTFERLRAEDPELAAEVELGRRIDASLRHAFRAPARPGAAAERLVVSAASGAPTARWGRRAAALLAVAAAMVLLVRLVGDDPGAGSPLPGDADSLCPVGPLAAVEVERELTRAASPDLETLYEQAVFFSEGRTMACGSGDDLAAALAATYGEEVRLQPEAANMLHGPFSSPEWPTGTILTGFPENRTAVLVAELDAMHRCCVRVELPAGSRLRTFTWRVGGIVLTEITPLPEPRLLGYFLAAAGGD